MNDVLGCIVAVAACLVMGAWCAVATYASLFGRRVQPPDTPPNMLPDAPPWDVHL